jgi:xanthine dehydrogenase YagS FAD-binding subunit
MAKKLKTYETSLEFFDLPWRLTRSEAVLIGRAPDAEAIAAAGDMAIEHARPLAHDGFKITLLRNAVIRALQTIGGQP